MRVDLPLDKRTVENQDWAAGPSGHRATEPAFSKTCLDLVRFAHSMIFLQKVTIERITIEARNEGMKPFTCGVSLDYRSTGSTRLMDIK